MKLAVASGVSLLIAAASVACEGAGEPPITLTASDSADQVLFEFRTTITIDGVRRVHLEADTAYFYQRVQQAELIGVHVEFFSVTGEHTSTITSIDGTYDWRTQNMEARGDVVATTPDNRRLTTDTLRYDHQRNEIYGPTAFVFDAPDRHLEGDAFTSDPDFERVETVRPRRGRIGEVGNR